MHTGKGNCGYTDLASVHRLIAMWAIDTACMSDELVADDHMAALCRLQKDGTIHLL